MYKTIHIDSSAAEGLEPLGTKRKFWFTDHAEQRFLFKAEERGTGEDWAEKIACELSALLGLPHVHYELAAESADVPGVICASCAPPPSALVLGNQLMFDRDPAYPALESRKYKIRQHTTNAVLDVLKDLQMPPPPWSEILPKGISSAIEVFIGYAMLDAWIANQDRHHENWGALRINGVLHLAPTFDHGASMARNLSDIERNERLKSPDKGYGLDVFAARARSAFYVNDVQTRPMTTLQALSAFSRIAPQATTIWFARLAAITDMQVHTILEQIPPHRISAIGRRFTFELLAVNRKRILQGDQK